MELGGALGELLDACEFCRYLALGSGGEGGRLRRRRAAQGAILRSACLSPEAHCDKGLLCAQRPGNTPGSSREARGTPLGSAGIQPRRRQDARVQPRRRQDARFQPRRRQDARIQPRRRQDTRIQPKRRQDARNAQEAPGRQNQAQKARGRSWGAAFNGTKTQRESKF